jgi:hypothetical protein
MKLNSAQPFEIAWEKVPKTRRRLIMNPHTPLFLLFNGPVNTTYNEVRFGAQMGFITQLTPKLISQTSQLILYKHAMTGPLANGGHSNDAGIILYFISPSRCKHSLH